MSSGYVEERKRFSKKKNKTAENQYMDNFLEFTKEVKNKMKALDLNLHGIDVFVLEIKVLIDDFDKAQEELITEVEQELK